MAAAVLGKTEVGVNEFGRDVEVPENPIAKLMYYFDSICYAMDMNRAASPDKIKKLRNYSQYRQLSEEDRDLLLLLCVRFSPDELINKCLFLDEEMCGNDMNKFYKLGAVHHRFVITEEIVIGGQVTRVMKILCFRKIWLEYCYLEPIKNLQKELRAIAGKLSGRTAEPATTPSARAMQPRRPQAPRATPAPRQIQQSPPPPPPTKKTKDDGCMIM